MDRTQPHPHAGTEAGMTLIEVIVAMAVLLVGVLGVVGTLDLGHRVTNDNLERDTATALVREQLETVREMPYATLANPTSVVTSLTSVVQGAVPSSVLSAAGSLLTSPPNLLVPGAILAPLTPPAVNTALDDPVDGIGAVVGTPCKPLATASGGGGATAASGGATTLNLNILGIQVTGSGLLADVVCGLFGTRGSIVDTLLGLGAAVLKPLISAGADTTFCAGKGNVAIDRQASDATAITATVTWTYPGTNRTGQVTQRVIVQGPQVVS